MAFVGIHMQSEQAEASHTACIWEYTSGDLELEFRWGGTLSDPHDWKTAFTVAAADWINSNTVVDWQYDAYAVNSMNKYDLDDGWLGFNSKFCGGPSGTISSNDMWGNVFGDSHTYNERRCIAGHEIGHAVELDHSGSSADLMYTTHYSLNTSYIPQSGDETVTNDQYLLDQAIK